MDRLKQIIDICNLYKQGKYRVEEFQSWLGTALLPEPETELGKLVPPLVFDAIESLEEVRFLYGNNANDQGIAVADNLIENINKYQDNL